MRCFFVIGLLVSGCCCFIDLSGDSDDVIGSSAESAAVLTVIAYDAVYVDLYLAWLRVVVGCDLICSAMLGHFCPVVTGWASGIVAMLSTLNVVYPGVTMWILTMILVDVAYQWIGRFSVLVFQGGIQGDLISLS